MPAPNLSLQVEPFENNKVAYLPMAAKTSQEKARGRVILQLRITNNEGQSVTVESVKIEFPGSGISAETKTINKSIAKTKSLLWWFAEPKEDVLFDLPGPADIKLSIKCTGFSPAKSFTFKLAPHASPVAGGAYLFPSAGADLKLGEFWQLNGCTHAMGSEGSQSFAYDMGVWGVNHDDNTHSWLLPSTNGNANADHRIFGKPVRAMADGEVVHFLNECPNNPAPLSWTSQADLDQKMQKQRDDFWGAFNDQHGGAGNHLYIQHGDEVMLYAHMQKGSILKKFLAVGAKVKAGEKLGLAGNAGNSTAPHLHIHAIQGTQAETGPLRPIILRDAWAIDNDLIQEANQRGFWSQLNKRGIPEGSTVDWWKGDCFISPSPHLPEWPEIVKLSVNETDYQSVFNEMKARGLKPVLFDGFTWMNMTWFNIIFRPATGIVYEARHGMDGTEYQAEFNKWVNDKKYRLAHIESYWSHARDRICYAALFEKSPGPDFSAYHGRSKAEHESLIETLKGQGFAPVEVSVVSTGGQRSYAARWEKRDVGQWEIRSTLSPAEFDNKFDANHTAGLHLVNCDAYWHSNDLNLAGIWHSKAPGVFCKFHLNQSEFNSHLKAQRKQNRYLRGLAGYRRDAGINWIAHWSA